ncbi:M16 family metallopeptidase [Streptomyces sp. NPDC093250]|uniref:M16 family metallopeptidase n=1 Tax=Streptomyces sp. NPDC093250 TaxID=3366036 RepID=UPI003803C6DF
MPTPVDTVLANGLRVIAVRRPSTPMVELRMALPCAGDTHARAAAAEVLVTTLLRDSPDGGEQLHSELARQGISLHASRSARWLDVSGSAPGQALRPLLDALTRALVSSSCGEGGMAQIRMRMQRQISVIRSQPHVIAQEALFAHCYGEVPGLQDVPLAADVARVTVAAVQELHRTVVRPRGAVLVVVGDLDPERAVADVASATAEWEDAGDPPPGPELPALRAGIALVSRPGAVQSQVKLTRHVVPRADDRFPAVSLAALTFGGYFSSRLVTNIREEKGLAYRTDTGFQDHLNRLALAVDADTATDVTAEAFGEIAAELERLVDTPPLPAEIDAAREYTIGMAMLALTSQAGFASSVLTAVTLGHEPERVTRFPQMLRDVTTDEVADAARAFFRPDTFSGVVVGDAERIEPGLRALLGDRLVARRAV